MKNYAWILLLFITATAFINPPSEKPKAIDEELDVKFRIQICAYENHVPHDKVETMRKIGKVMVVKRNGWAYYYSKEYATDAEATSQLPFYLNAGFENAFEVAQINDQFYTLEDYYKLLKEREKESKESPIHIYK